MVSLHESYADLILHLAEESTRTGAPIIRPIWWTTRGNAGPRDPSLTVSDQFLLGDQVLVAPIVKPGARDRDIYLPPGQWRDELHNGTLLEGGRWYKDYNVALDELPRFTRVPA